MNDNMMTCPQCRGAGGYFDTNIQRWINCMVCSGNRKISAEELDTPEDLLVDDMPDDLRCAVCGHPEYLGIGGLCTHCVSVRDFEFPDGDREMCSI